MKRPSEDTMEALEDWLLVCLGATIFFTMLVMVGVVLVGLYALVTR